MGIIETVKQGKPVPCPVIDTHVHIGACSDAGLFQPFASLEETVEYADAVGIDALVTSPITLSFGDMKRTNDETVEAIRAFPGRIYGNVFVSPCDGYEGAKAVVDKYSKISGFVAFKLLTGYLGELDNPAYDYVWAFAQEAQCPVTCHIYGKDPSQRSVLATLKRFPDVKLILAHQGGGYAANTEFFAEYMKDYRLYLDTCGTLNNTMGLWEMAQLCGEDRLVYGSDVLYMEPRYEIGKIVFSGMPETVMKKIFAENYLKILEGSSLSKITL